MRDIAIISYAQTPQLRDAGAQNDIELVMDVTHKAMDKVNFTIDDIDFICSGSCDYLGGAAFAFVNAVDALGAVPPKVESHVEMDAAWALYEAWLKMQMGHTESALIYGFGKSSHCEMRMTPTLQLDPYYYTPLWPDTISLAGLQACTLLDQGKYTEEDFAKVVVNSRKQALSNPQAQLKGDVTVEQILAEQYIVDPLRKSDCCPVTDGASALVMVTREKAEQLIADGKIEKAAYITGLDHRTDTHALGSRDLSIATSASIAAEKAGVGKGGIDIAELYAPFSFQELMLKEAMGIGENTKMNPSGGTLAGHAFMSHGLERIGEVADRIIKGEAGRGVAHATSGPCLQQNLVAVLEA
ncbi:MAG: lipid-transfer protein [Cellvibrionales bacterium]|nr:lipid-transfer protein [Cellvibrionales bacterium]